MIVPSVIGLRADHRTFSSATLPRATHPRLCTVITSEDARAARPRHLVRRHLHVRSLAHYCYTIILALINSKDVLILWK